MNINELIIKPVLTEKATDLVKRNVYTFEVHPRANKFQIAERIEAIFKVKVSNVKIAMRHGKIRKVGRKMQKVQLRDRKIAYVGLKEGKIDIFPQP